MRSEIHKSSPYMYDTRTHGKIGYVPFLFSLHII